MKIIDISWPVNEQMAEFGGRHEVELQPYGNETKVTMINHTGTHVDGPRYFFNNKPTIDQYDLTKLVGMCSVLDLTSVRHAITQADLEQHTIEPETTILFKTRNSQLSDTAWDDDFVFLDVSGAEYLAQKQVKSIGIDYLALETTPGFPSHHALLQHDILIIEGLRLKEVTPKNYEIVCLPVKLTGVDAAFGRAILIER